MQAFGRAGDAALRQQRVEGGEQVQIQSGFHGTSFDVSTLYLAAGVRDNGGGRVVTTEVQADNAAAALAAVVGAPVDDPPVWEQLFAHGPGNQR